MEQKLTGIKTYILLNNSPVLILVIPESKKRGDMITIKLNRKKK